jgi:hypothetical protein
VEDEYAVEVRLGKGVELGRLRPVYDRLLTEGDFHLEQGEGNGTGIIRTNRANAVILKENLGGTFKGSNPPLDVVEN